MTTRRAVKSPQEVTAAYMKKVEKRREDLLKITAALLTCPWLEVETMDEVVAGADTILQLIEERSKVR